MLHPRTLPIATSLSSIFLCQHHLSPSMSPLTGTIDSLDHSSLSLALLSDHHCDFATTPPPSSPPVHDLTCSPLGLHFQVGTWNLGQPKSMFPGHGHSKWFQNKLSLIPFKVRAVFFFCIDSVCVCLHTCACTLYFFVQQLFCKSEVYF